VHPADLAQGFCQLENNELIDLVSVVNDKARRPGFQAPHSMSDYHTPRFWLQRCSGTITKSILGMITRTIFWTITTTTHRHYPGDDPRQPSEISTAMITRALPKIAPMTVHRHQTEAGC
jgi:hypothetical protein